MTIKRLILILLTIVAIAQVGFSLIQSWGQPQIQSRLELYQTNLLLLAAEWQENSQDSALNPPNLTLTPARNAIVGTEPFKTAAKQYQEARELAVTTRSQLLKQQKTEITDSSSNNELPKSMKKVEDLINELDLRLGIIQSHQGDIDTALKTWTRLIAEKNSYQQTAIVLKEIWSNSSKLQPKAENTIKKDLDGWFRERTLIKLYQQQQRPDLVLKIQTELQKKAQQAIVKLTIVAAIPGLGLVLGIGLLIFLVIQRLIKGKESLLSKNAELVWVTPWDGETIWQVFIVGFFFVGQILLPYLVLPLIFGLLGLNPASFDVRLKAFYILATYIFLASGGLLVLYLSLKQFLPLSSDWFRINWRGGWIFWGIGGYFVALPFVIIVSLINQKIWQGQGGSNPILPIALESKDGLALSIFFLTAAVLAPIFEEILFRGFLLPSLTRYLPPWGAILLSGLLFAIAHLSLSEVLPLMTLGIILGIVYTRSRNLLASMLLHSLWNSGTLLSLFVLGSGTN